MPAETGSLRGSGPGTNQQIEVAHRLIGSSLIAVGTAVVLAASAVGRLQDKFAAALSNIAVGGGPPVYQIPDGSMLFRRLRCAVLNLVARGAGGLGTATLDIGGVYELGGERDVALQGLGRISSLLLVFRLVVLGGA